MPLENTGNEKPTKILQASKLLREILADKDGDGLYGAWRDSIAKEFVDAYESANESKLAPFTKDDIQEIAELAATNWVNVISAPIGS